MIDRFLGDAFGILPCSFWSTAVQCGARLQIHALNYCTMCPVVPILSDLSDIAHRRSVAVLCMLYKIMCNPSAVTRGALVAHRYTCSITRCKTSHYRRTFIPLSVSTLNDLADLVLNDVGLAGFKSLANSFLLTEAALSLLSSTIFPLLVFLSIGWYYGAGVF